MSAMVVSSTRNGGGDNGCPPLGGGGTGRRESTTRHVESQAFKRFVRRRSMLPPVSTAPEPRFRPRPVHRASAAQQIAAQIRAAMRAGELAAGERLPSELELAAAFGVSRPTVREAMRILAASNLVEASRGAG